MWCVGLRCELPACAERAAWLADVYVDPSVRGKGVGTGLVGGVREYLRPFGVRRVLLATHDAHGVYEKLGFAPLPRPDQWMALYYPTQVEPD